LLAKCIQDFKDDCPIWIFAHSFGGIVAANWLCRELVEPNHAKLKESVKRIFLFASPIFPNYDFFRVEHPTNKETLALYLGEYIERSPTLLDCYTEFVVGYSPEDKMARIEEVLFSRHLPQASHFPAEGREVAISDTDHFTICNHEQVLGVVSHWCGL
jgi:pimeloyl-ACP methyl ester carboxylesterase